MSESAKPEASAGNTEATAPARVIGRPFVKGVSGNPQGRPKVVAEVRELAREHGPAAIVRLTELMKSQDGQVAIAACRELLNRAYGKPEQSINLPNGGALVNVTIGAPITSAEEAQRIYQEFMRNPQLDVSELQFASRALPGTAAPAAALLEGEPIEGADEDSHVESEITAPTSLRAEIPK